MIAIGMPGQYKNFLRIRMVKLDRKIWLANAIIAVSAAILFIPFLGGVHLFDWDEINFAESAREMIASGNYLTVQINFVPFWEKPPLFIWMQVLSMHLFGINEFAARLPNAICGIVTLLVLFNIGRKFADIRFGLLWVLFYGSSILPFFYFKSGIIDPWFNLFTFLGIYQFYLYLSRSVNKILYLAASALFIGLAILTKGPVALLIFILVTGIYLILIKLNVRIRISDILVFSLVLILTGGFYFLIQFLKGNFSIVEDFISYQIRLFKTKDAGHGGFMLYHFVVLFAGVFPASVFALPVLFGSRTEAVIKKDFCRLMLVLFWVVLILFTIVRTKIVHYSSLCYFPLTYLAGWLVYHSNQLSLNWKKIINVLTLLLGILLLLAVTAIVFLDFYKGFLISHNWIKDSFAVACLDTSGLWTGYEALVGFILLAGLYWFNIVWRRNQSDKGVIILTTTMAIYLFCSMLLITPPIEAYSQRPAVEFFRTLENQDAYLATLGYKSYTHLFYGKAKKYNNPLSRDSKWLLTGNIDKNAFFAAKINKKEMLMKDFPLLEFLYEKNGFVFFKRTTKTCK
jgi:4-amino-4-deoxy-L-arabinose transferase-like glycosyltransferase